MKIDAVRCDVCKKQKDLLVVREERWYTFRSTRYGGQDAGLAASELSFDCCPNCIGKLSELIKLPTVVTCDPPAVQTKPAETNGHYPPLPVFNEAAVYKGSSPTEAVRDFILRNPRRYTINNVIDMLGQCELDGGSPPRMAVRVSIINLRKHTVDPIIVLDDQTLVFRSMLNDNDKVNMVSESVRQDTPVA